jgi:hypothetical protein
MRRIGTALIALIVVASAASIVTWSITKANSASNSNSSVAECMQAQLQGAMEQRGGGGGGGGGTTYIPLGYTFLIVNIGTQSCELRGYPYEVLFSTTAGVPVKVSISHQRNILYAQPTARRVVLSPGGVASFGISYANDNASPPSTPATCIATLIDFRLPARMSALYSFEFLLRPIDFCQTARKVSVTPVEGRAAPQT